MRYLIQALLLSAILIQSPLTVGADTSDNAASDITISASEAAALYSPITTYTIFRKGKNIGHHTLSVDESNGAVSVNIDSNITVRVLKIPVFKFRYKSAEKWTDGQLSSVESITTTNKEIENSAMSNAGSKSLLSNASGNSETELLQFATNHWHIGAVSQSRLFNTIKGIDSNVTVTRVGKETLSIKGQSITATHFKYSGDIIADSWYDDNNRWVQLAFLGTDGSSIKYVIDNP